MRALIERFTEAIDQEVALLEKEGRDRTYELISGRRDPASGGGGGVFIFLLADPLRLPEDASGHLPFNEVRVSAMVVAQEGNRLWLLLEPAESLPSVIASARLVLSQTELLIKLKERLQELREFRLAPKVLGLKEATSGWQEIADGSLPQVPSGMLRDVLEQILGSEVTFVWGPPGTGKTHMIAALVATLVRREESVLVTSHTHSAVEQALWAAVEPESESRPAGPLADSSFVKMGRILKVGPLRQSKIPKRCHLDSYMAEAQAERHEEIARLVAERSALEDRLSYVNSELAPWAELDIAKERKERVAAQLRDARAALSEAAAEVRASRDARAKAQQARDKAKRSLLFRKRRMARASQSMRAAATMARRAQVESDNADRLIRMERQALERTKQDLEAAKKSVTGLPSRRRLETEDAKVRTRLRDIEAKQGTLQSASDGVANNLLDSALAVFATLTKVYMDQKLRTRSWDTVVVDEVSMAMPPLVAMAASCANKRVVLVGDFYQLPPIVHSRDGIAAEELGTDVFERAGIVTAVESGRDHPQLALLDQQRRMHPDIASVARRLVYQERLHDHPSIETRQRPGWCSALGTDAPLVIVDISRLNTWCGKMPHTLSRFNFYSAQVAVELAALFAAALEKPGLGEAPPLGIVTPYAAQRRYLAKLVEMLSLAPWVTPGTVHTFQGAEADAIIFDSVLAEPHWTARFTNPHEFESVRRDLNVAVTRARHQFVFVADVRWLDRNAKDGSGYGVLWRHLNAVATRLDATDLLGNLRGRVAANSTDIGGWSIASAPKAMTLLDETTFYPAFVKDLAEAKERVILFTPYIGKVRWPQIEAHILSLTDRGVEVVLLHKPLTDEAWRSGDPSFGESIFRRLDSAGVRRIEVSGIHAKTIVIDGLIVYDGSLNWASHTATYEHMWRMESKDAAVLVDRLLQVGVYVNSNPVDLSVCPHCQGPLIVVNQREKANLRFRDTQPLKAACRRATRKTGNHAQGTSDESTAGSRSSRHPSVRVARRGISSTQTPAAPGGGVAATLHAGRFAGRTATPLRTRRSICRADSGANQEQLGSRSKPRGRSDHGHGCSTCSGPPG